MSRLDVARDRIAKALERLEKAAAHQARSQTDNTRNIARLGELEAERDRLLARIAQLEEEITALSGLTEEVEGRLDGAIGEIRAALAR